MDRIKKLKKRTVLECPTAPESVVVLRCCGSCQHCAFVLHNTVPLLTHGQETVPCSHWGVSPSLLILFSISSVLSQTGAKEDDTFCRRNSLPTKLKRTLNWCLKRSQVGSSVRSFGIVAKKAIRPCPRSSCAGFAVVGWISPQFQFPLLIVVSGVAIMGWGFGEQIFTRKNIRQLWFNLFSPLDT